MACIVCTCKKCGHQVTVSDLDELSACENRERPGDDECGCVFYNYRRITSAYELTPYDRAFLIRECGIRPE